MTATGDKWESGNGVTLHCADCRDVVPKLSSVDSIICDPPYGLSFMGKHWDHGVPGVVFWEEALQAAKPGAHLLAFGGTRTFHRLTCAIEDAGWEIRDCVMWVYGSGFPKSHDVSKAIDKAAGAERAIVGEGQSFGRGSMRNRSRVELGYRSTEVNPEGGTHSITAPATAAARQWQGWGTALKPAWEPIIVARKPLEGTVAENVLEYGTGGINVDACRVAHSGEQLNGGPSDGKLKRSEGWNRPWMHSDESAMEMRRRSEASIAKAESLGRWPANVIHDGSDEVVGLFPDAAGAVSNGKKAGTGFMGKFGGMEQSSSYADSGSAARFFYCAKASKSDRDDGNKHPTVKPNSLMRYLCRLVTPPGGTILDNFMGSGSTGKAAAQEGFRFIGIEREREHFDTAVRRIQAVLKSSEYRVTQKSMFAEAST